MWHWWIQWGNKRPIVLPQLKMQRIALFLTELILATFNERSLFSNARKNETRIVLEFCKTCFRETLPRSKTSSRSTSARRQFKFYLIAVIIASAIVM